MLSPDEKHHEVRSEDRGYEHVSGESFDRIAFAMRALAILRPPKMKVVVYERCERFHVERGRDLRRGPGASFALVGIPRHASRAYIAYRLAELTGAVDVPYLLPVLLADTR